MAKEVIAAVAASKEFKKILDNYRGKDGKLSYALLNKDMIKFAHNSSIVRKMRAEQLPVDTILLYVVGSKFRNITGNRKLSDETVLEMIGLLDEESHKSVFRELKEDIRQKSSKRARR